MNQLKYFIGRVKREYKRNKKAVIKKIFLVIIGVALFVSGYLLSANVWLKPISNSEFEYYEQVATDFYYKGVVTIEEVAQRKLNIHLEDTKIIISSTRMQYAGRLMANYESGELVFTREVPTFGIIIVNILVGILFVLFFCLIIRVLDSSNLKKRKDK